MICATDLEQQDIETRRKAIEIGLRVWTEADRRSAGVIVTINRTGELEILRGLLSEADRKAQAERGVRASGNCAARDEAGVHADHDGSV